ncbi:MAG: DUF420 domain-containing protein [Planctomycetes bacterium]|nr:DUF420 domain-containing protein [Planctomycetota bacterium]
MPAAADLSCLADVDAALNAVATVLIVLALRAIRRGDVAAHKRLVLAAVTVSAAFLACYLVYHFTVPHRPFGQPGWIRWIYYPLLISHVVLATVQVPLLLRTLWLGLRDRREQHRKWARVTAPIWLYVSVTGVIVYWMAFRM